jgi:YebC/PmpR family DNA-binding regulatory protein
MGCKAQAHIEWEFEPYPPQASPSWQAIITTSHYSRWRLQGEEGLIQNFTPTTASLFGYNKHYGQTQMRVEPKKLHSEGVCFMSGHSKWHNIRLRKGAQDAKRGNLFTKLAKEISIAAKAGGGNPDSNLRLRLAIQKARENSMPQDNIKRSIMRGTGELDGANYEESTYEGYGPGGVAVLVDVATDNKNRTVANIRSIFAKNGGRLGESGSVAYRFRPIGRVAIAKAATDEETLFTLAIEAGAEDVRVEEEHYEVIAQPEDFNAVRTAIENANVAIETAEYTMEPTDTIALDAKDAQLLFRMLERLEEDEDVQNVHSNFEVTDEVLAATN